MRKILFRGKRVDNGEWIYGDLAKLMHENHLCIMPDSFFGTRDFGEEDEKGNPVISDCLAIGGFFGVVSETVGQYTGLTDRNGKEIFEGDILQGYKYSNPIGNTDAVIFENGEFKLEKTPLKLIDVTYSLSKYQCEIIGNIHDKNNDNAQS